MTSTFNGENSVFVGMWSRFSQLRAMNMPFGLSFFGDEIERIREIEALTGQVLGDVDHLAIFPATHFVTNDDHMEVAIAKIQAELEEQLKVFEKEGKLLEAQRLKQRTEYDIEMLREMGYTNGVETTLVTWMDGVKVSLHTPFLTSSQKIFSS